MKRLFYLAVEKVSISSAAIENLEFVSKAAFMFGTQSIGLLQTSKNGLKRKYEVVIYNGTLKTGLDFIETAKKWKH